MMISKRQARKQATGRAGQPSRCNRRAERRLAVAMGAYEAGRKVPGKDKMVRIPGAHKAW